MNRRQFTTSLSALFAAPALPLKALTAAPVAATAVPNAARFWAIYMSQLHGTCTARTLSTMTGLDTATAQGYLSRMIGDGVITPTDIVSKALNARSTNSKQPSQWKERAQKFLEEKKQTTPTVEKITTDVDEPDKEDDHTEDDQTEVTK
jgi:hypothetical protein